VGAFVETAVVEADLAFDEFHLIAVDLELIDISADQEEAALAGIDV
jgi:hypothetical protein